MEDTNVVIITGNLTRDPEPRWGGKAAGLRVAVNGSTKDEHGNWVDDPNYFNVTLFGKTAENAIKYLGKGRKVLVEGRLDWSEYEKDGSKRQAVQVVGKKVTYLGSGEAKPSEEAEPAESEQAAAVGAGVGGAEDDIPF